MGEDATRAGSGADTLPLTSPENGLARHEESFRLLGMRTILLPLALSMALFGCKGASPAAATESPTHEAKAASEADESIPEISIDEAGEAIQSGAIAVDANSESTRKKNGTVPDAILLTSSSKYELSQLPQDKSTDLIFYCSNTRCTASDAAAERASAHGYQNVHIMREGIKGWRDAGKPTSAYPRS